MPRWLPRGLCGYHWLSCQTEKKHHSSTPRSLSRAPSSKNSRRAERYSRLGCLALVARVRRPPQDTRTGPEEKRVPLASASSEGAHQARLAETPLPSSSSACSPAAASCAPYPGRSPRPAAACRSPRAGQRQASGYLMVTVTQWPHRGERWSPHRLQRNQPVAHMRKSSPAR